MINRSSLKYTIKKILPRSLFSVVLLVWQKVLLRIVEKIDAFRLRKFSTYRTVKLNHGDRDFSLFISPSNGFIDRHIFLYGVYEPFMLDLFSKHLRPGNTFVDIGANIGQHSMYAATLVGKSGHVHAFEPIPALYQQIKDSVEANGYEEIVSAHNMALGSNESTEKFFVSKNIGGSSLVNNDETKETIDVRIAIGDKELSKLTTIDVMKIDVEGYEYEVLKGIKETLLTKKPALFLEFSGNFYKKQGNDEGRKIIKLLREYDYRLFDIEDDMKEIVDDTTFNSLISDVRIQTNLLCLAK